MQVTAYTDGSANWKTGEGGWASYIKFSKRNEKVICGGLTQTKTGRAEIIALLNTIREMPKNKGVKLHIYSDSQYVVNAFVKKWLINWKMKSFNGVKNEDLWRCVVKELSVRKIDLKITHIKGHQKIDLDDENVDEHILGNFIADNLADYKSHEVKEKDMSDEVWKLEKSNKNQ